MEGIFYYQLEEWCYINKESKESRMPNIYFNIIFGKAEQCFRFNITFCSSTSSQKVSLFQSLLLTARRSGDMFPNFCAQSDPCTRFSQHQKLRTSELKKYILHKGRVPIWWGRGAHQNFKKIFSIKGGRRGMLLLLTVTCSVIPDKLSSTSFKLQTSPSSSASLRSPSAFS